LKSLIKIAAFDSGTGGLTALAPLLRQFANLEVSYFGDLVNLPYGNKSPGVVRDLTKNNLEWLLDKFKCDMALVACNTASALAMDVATTVAKKHKVPILGVLDVTAEAAIENSPSHIVVLATTATIQSGAYTKKLRELGYKGDVVEKACPLLVPLVEDGLFEGPAVEWIIKHYVEKLIAPGDTVVLGCTHYPFLKTTLKSMYPRVSFIDAGEALVASKAMHKIVEKVSKTKSKGAHSHLDLHFSDTILSEDGVHNMLSRLGLFLDGGHHLAAPISVSKIHQGVIVG
jgi:glutamate racemase